MSPKKKAALAGIIVAVILGIVEWYFVKPETPKYENSDALMISIVHQPQHPDQLSDNNTVDHSRQTYNVYYNGDIELIKVNYEGKSTTFKGFLNGSDYAFMKKFSESAKNNTTYKEQEIKLHQYGKEWVLTSYDRDGTEHHIYTGIGFKDPDMDKAINIVTGYDFDK